jgi:HD-like signal output (HDOD) protein
MTQTVDFKPMIEELRRKEFNLPTLPDIALRVQRAAAKVSTTSQDLAKILAIEPVLAGQIIQAANSNLFKGLPRCHNMVDAINRLGVVCVQNLVVSMTVIQQFNYGNFEQFKDRLRRHWQHAAYVGAISEILAERFTDLEPTEALLGGLVHNIGALPILSYSWQNKDLFRDTRMMNKLFYKMQGELGDWILKNWNFPKEISKVPKQVLAYKQSSIGPINIGDIVLVANLHASLGNKNAMFHRANWSEVSTFEKLKLEPRDSIAAIRTAKERIQETVAMFRS